MVGSPWPPSDTEALVDTVKQAPRETSGGLHARLVAAGVTAYSERAVHNKLGALRLGSIAARVAWAGTQRSVHEGNDNEGAGDGTSAPPPLDLAADVQRKGQERDLRVENRRLREELERRANLTDALRAELAATPILTIPRPRISHDERPERTLLAICTDVHTGQLYSGDGGLGKYNLDEFARRASRYAEAIIQIAEDYRRSGPTERLVIVFGGDLVDGRLIHRGQAIQSEEMATQLNVGPRVMSEGVMAPLSEAFAHIDVFGCIGNHGRLGQKGEMARVGDSLDTVFMDILQLRCQGMPNITWHPRDLWYADFRLHGHRYFAAHGDNFKSWNAIPAYGAIRNKGRMEGITNSVIDVICTGHHHSAANLHVNHGLVVLNGSWVGASEFGTWLGMSGPPVQKLLSVTDRFPAAAIHDIYLVDPADCVTHEPIDLDTMRATVSALGLGRAAS